MSYEEVKLPMVWLLWNENIFLKVAFSYGEPKDKNCTESEKREHLFFS